MRKFISLILFTFFQTSLYASDISVTKVTLKYVDNVTDKNNIITRELVSIQDDTFWSKPYRVDIEVLVENLGKEKDNYINLKTELYHLLSPNMEQESFLAMPNELKTLTKEPTWVWSSNLDNQTINELLPGEKKVVYIKNKQVRENYYPTDYSINAFAVRVFATQSSKDKNYANNVNHKVINYGD